MSIENLIQDLTRCHKLLTSVDEDWWSGKMKAQVEGFKSGTLSTASVARNILSWYGGMGSFNDRHISQFNGDNVDPSQEDLINSKLIALQIALYENANAIITSKRKTRELRKEGLITALARRLLRR